MKVMLWCDMEGVAGISVWEQVNGGAALYEEGRRLYTAEVNAAVRGCKRVHRYLELQTWLVAEAEETMVEEATGDAEFSKSEVCSG